MSIELQQTDPVHLALLGEMKDAVSKYDQKLSIEEMLAITCQLAGNLFGLRHIVNPGAEVQETMDICIKNIDMGTAMAMEGVIASGPGEETKQ